MTEDADERMRRAYRSRPTLYHDEGDGDPVVFAHGTLMDRTMWEPQVRALAPEYRTVAYDLRARTEHYSPEYSLDDLADDCAALLDALDVDSCVLAGMSMGGFTALKFALRHPERLDGLVLVDSMADVHGETQTRTYEAMVDQLLASESVPRALAETASQILFGETTRAENPELVESWLERWLSYSPEAVANEVGSWMHRDSLVDRVDEIEVPALVVHGDEDTSIPVEKARETAEALPDGRIDVVEEAGHSSNLEKPETVNRALRGFLEEVV